MHTIARLSGLSRHVLAVLALASAPSMARAQSRTVPVISLDGAKTMVAAAESEAKKNGWNMTIAIVDPAGELVLLHRSDDAGIATVDNARRKALTAARFRRATKEYEEQIKAGRVVLLNFDNMLPVEGGLPIVVDGKVIGAIGVSGATSPQDAQVAQAGIDALGKK